MWNTYEPQPNNRILRTVHWMESYNPLFSWRICRNSKMLLCEVWCVRNSQSWWMQESSKGASHHGPPGAASWRKRPLEHCRWRTITSLLYLFTVIPSRCQTFSLSLASRHRFVSYYLSYVPIFYSRETLAHSLYSATKESKQPVKSVAAICKLDRWYKKVDCIVG